MASRFPSDVGHGAMRARLESPRVRYATPGFLAGTTRAPRRRQLPTKRCHAALLFGVIRAYQPDSSSKPLHRQPCVGVLGKSFRPTREMPGSRHRRRDRRRRHKPLDGRSFHISEPTEPNAETRRTRVRRVVPSSLRLLERGECGGQENLVLLRQQVVAAAGGRPDPALARFATNLRALIEARVRPDVHEPVGAAELDAAGEHQGRELRALGQSLLPPLGDLRERARLERVVAQLEDRPHLAAGLGDEVEGHDDLRAHLPEEFLDTGVPLRIIGRLATDALALGVIPVRPHVDDLVERSDLRVPEGEQLRVLLAVLVGLAEALLDLRQAAGGDAIGADLVDHAGLLSCRGRSIATRLMRAPAYGRARPASTDRWCRTLDARRVTRVVRMT